MKGIIIGGGIGGLTTAIALRQHGIEATVMEAAPELSAVGAGIVMATNAMQVMVRLGLAEKIKERGYTLTSARVADQHWRSIQEVDVDFIIRKYGIGSIAIHRAALQKILFEELTTDLVKLNHKVKSIHPLENKIRVLFENGHEEETDFVIGADGIKSAVRQSLFGKTSYRYSGQTCWRAAVEMPIPEKLRNCTYELWGSKAGLRFGMVAIREDLVYFFATVCAPQGGKDDPRTLKAELIQLFGEFGEIPGNLIQATDVEKIIRTDIYDFAPIPKWYMGIAALVGDAAHATTPNLGQGGCQAVEDAYVIAKMMKLHQDPEKAFEAFQQIRYAKAKFVVNSSWQFGKMTNLSPSWLIHLRNAALRMLPDSVGIKTLDKLFTLNY